MDRDKCRERTADLVILGGGTGGCAAALAAARNGLTVILTEETDWIGGQFTQQAVPPDEHPWIESFGCTRSYRALRDGVREYYRRHYPLAEAARRDAALNPGMGGVSRLCHEPRVSLAVLLACLAPYRSAGRVTILLEHKAVAADADGDRVRAVTVRDLRDGRESVLNAPYFIDATELGDLLPITGTEYVTGFESQADTGEMHAPPEAQPLNQQSFTFCFAMDHLPGEDHTIERPEQYDFWREHVPKLTPPWPGRLLAWPYTHPITLEPVTDIRCDPVAEASWNGTGPRPGFWTFRRIAYKAHFAPGAYRSDICLVNWPHIDYMLGNLCDVSPQEAADHLHAARQLSLSFLHWMQTEAGLPGLRLRPDIVATADGLAKYPYIREARRIRPEFTVLEQHVGTEQRMQLTGLGRDDVAAEVFEDSVGVGSYRIDLHPSSGGDNYLDISSLPFQIPLGALIPQRVENLLPGCKNLGVTHITNGCYRLHPVEWNIGEAAALLVAFCLANHQSPRGVRNTEPRLRDFQRMLRGQGVELAWPSLTPR